MGAVTARGRALVVVAFVVAALLFAGASVAFVLASRHDTASSPLAVPSVHPTLVLPTDQPTATPTPSPTMSPTPTPVPTPSARPTPSRTPSPAARRTSPAPVPTRAVQQHQLATSATINIVSGGTTADTYVVRIHATDPDTPISLRSVSWRAGETSPTEPGTECSPAPAPPADCRNFTLSHRYDAAGSYLITIEVVSGDQDSVVHFTVDVAAAPSPSPTAS